MPARGFSFDLLLGVTKGTFIRVEGQSLAARWCVVLRAWAGVVRGKYKQ